MSTTPVTSYLNMAAATQPANSSTAANSSAVSSASTASLGENDFMTLLIAQLKNQDPLNPQDSSAFVAELAQFSSLQQQTQVNQNLQQFAANSMLGYEVTDNTGDTGVVTSVSNGGPNSTTGLQLNIINSSGQSVTVDYSNITQVTLPSSQSTSGQGTGSS